MSVSARATSDKQRATSAVRNLGISRSRNLGMPESRDLGVSASRNARISECRNLGMPESLVSRAPTMARTVLFGRVSKVSKVRTAPHQIHPLRPFLLKFVGFLHYFWERQKVKNPGFFQKIRNLEITKYTPPLCFC